MLRYIDYKVPKHKYTVVQLYYNILHSFSDYE